MTLRVGFAERDITPPLGLPLGGYGARVGGADAILDPLCCRAVFFDDGKAPATLVVMDLVHVFGEWVARVRAHAQHQLGLVSERVMIAATHTHAGPAVFRSSIERDERVRQYEDELIDRVVATIGQARARAQPAQLRFGARATKAIAANRRDPSLAADPFVRTVSAHAADGTPLGVIANFACHPTVLSASNHGYSGDLLGAAARRTSERVRAPTLFTNGAAGDVSTRFTRRTQAYAEVERLGSALADAAAAAVRASEPVATCTPMLAPATGTVPLRWRTLPSANDAMTELQTATEQLETLRARATDPAMLRVAQARVEGAQAAAWLVHHEGWQALFGSREPVAQVSALRCGDVTLLAAPGELFSAAAAWLRTHLGERTLVVGYANDYLGYFVPRADAEAGGYEALIAMVEPACEADIRAGLLAVARAAEAQ